MSMPNEDSRSLAFGPIPLTLRAGSGQIRVAISAWVRIVRPSGLSSSEPIFANSLKLGQSQPRPGAIGSGGYRPSLCENAKLLRFRVSLYTSQAATKPIQVDLKGRVFRLKRSQSSKSNGSPLTEGYKTVVASCAVIRKIVGYHWHASP